MYKKLKHIHIYEIRLKKHKTILAKISIFELNPLDFL